MEKDVANYIDMLCEEHKDFAEATDISFVLPCGKHRIEFLDHEVYKGKDIHFFRSCWVGGTGQVFSKKIDPDTDSKFGYGNSKNL